MKKFKRYLGIILIILVMIINTSVYATDFNCALKMQANPPTIKAGSTVEVDVIVDSLVLSDSAPGITTVRGYLEYDANIFEDVVKADIDAGEEANVTYTQENKKLRIEFDSFDTLIKTSGSTLFKLKLKVKNDANVTNTTVKFNTVDLTDNNQKIRIETVMLELQPGADEPEPTPTATPTAAPTATPTAKPTATPTAKPTATPTSSNIQNKIGNITGQSINPTGKSDNTKSNTIIPKTGIGSIVTLIFIVSGFSIIMYVKYNKMKDIK